MSNSILYYPTIEFRHEDYQWLWNAALFADKIYRIVPPGYELNESRNISCVLPAKLESHYLLFRIQKKRVKNFRSLWMRIIEKQLRFR